MQEGLLAKTVGWFFSLWCPFLIVRYEINDLSIAYNQQTAPLPFLRACPGLDPGGDARGIISIFLINDINDVIPLYTTSTIFKYSIAT
jgi:hypothetical protein